VEAAALALSERNFLEVLFGPVRPESEPLILEYLSPRMPVRVKPSPESRPAAVRRDA
jgi:hypothetical protein